MSIFTYENTLEPSGTILSRFSPGLRKSIVYVLFLITEIGLIAGAFVDPVYWQWVVWFSIFNALLFLFFVGFKPMVFPAQLRIAYAIWVAIGTFVPYMSWMMWVTLFGLAANLLVGWCPLARMMYLLPWNRQQKLTGTVFLKTFFSKPRPGRFKVSTSP
jgi:hypothetical protein